MPVILALRSLRQADNELETLSPRKKRERERTDLTPYFRGSAVCLLHFKFYSIPKLYAKTATQKAF
jgi:hypothetical protein